VTFFRLRETGHLSAKTPCGLAVSRYDSSVLNFNRTSMRRIRFRNEMFVRPRRFDAPPARLRQSTSGCGYNLIQVVACGSETAWRDFVVLRQSAMNPKDYWFRIAGRHSPPRFALWSDRPFRSFRLLLGNLADLLELALQLFGGAFTLESFEPEAPLQWDCHRDKTLAIVARLIPLHLHPHLHCVVPGGGFSPDGSPGSAAGRIPCSFLTKCSDHLFRKLFLLSLGKAFRKGQLHLPGELRDLAKPAAFQAL